MDKKWKILHEDNSIIVVHKFPGIATESARIGSTDLVSELRKYLKKSGNSYIGLIHRLDQPVEGILVFAKNSKAAAELTKQVQYDEKSGKGMTKLYRAVLYGHMKDEKGSLTDYLVKDGKTNLSRVVNKDSAKTLNAKKAVLEYEVITLEKTDYTETVNINLKTGRHHQIRVQFANAGCPLLGDTKYGTEESKNYSKDNNIDTVQLKAYRLELKHPDTNRKLTFEI